MASMSILRPGMFTTVQDLGRWGFQARGVPVSGALDWYSHRLANSLLGNDPAMATLEVTLSGPHIRFDAATEFAVTGAEFQIAVNGAPAVMNRRVHAAAGAVVTFGERLHGARAYIAVTGGVAVPQILGSRSTHVLTATGGHDGRAVRTGDVLPIGGRMAGHATTSAHALPLTPVDARATKLRTVIVEQPLARRVVSQRFRVSPRSDRMGYRLEGVGFAQAQAGDMISTAVPTGAIQVPPTGQPILLMNDHATTGGYPIAAIVITADLPLAGQLAPGDWVEFEECSVSTAVDALREREAALGAA